MTDDRDNRTGPTPAKDEPTPAGGPHAKPELTDYDKTPGAGTLPDEDADETGDGVSS